MAKELLAATFFSVGAGLLGGGERLDDGVFDRLIDALKAEEACEFGTGDGFGSKAVALKGGEPDFEGTDTGDDEIALLAFAPEDEGIVRLGMPDGLSEGLPGARGLERQFLDCQGKLGEGVSLGPTVDDFEELVNALNVKLMTSDLAQTG